MINLFLIFGFLATAQLAYCQKNVVSYFKTNNEITEFNINNFKKIFNFSNDSIPIKIYNDFFKSNNRVYYLKNGVKKINYSIGKASAIPTETEVTIDNKTSKGLIYKKIYPIFKKVFSNYINLYFLHYSFTSIQVIILSIDPRNEIVSGIVLLEGDFNYQNKEIMYERVKSKFINDIYIIDKASGLPDKEIQTVKYKQREDGYFEEITY